MPIAIREDKDIAPYSILGLYKLNKWSSADKPDELYKALMNSHSLVTAWDGEQLVGLGNALSDGYLVVYYPHLLVDPSYHGQGIGKLIVDRMQVRYGHLHMQRLTADGGAVEFYKKQGFQKAGGTVPMWIYQGNEH